MSIADEIRFGDVSCAVCEQRRAAWLHHLDGPRSHFRVHGKGHVWGSPAALCETCDGAVTSGEVDVLVDRDPRSRRLSGTDLDEQSRNGLVALVGATVRRESLSAADPPGWQDAVAAGFTPMERITGASHLVHGWPEQHRRSVPAQDPDLVDHLPDGRHWFIRSPWPTVDLEPLWHLVIHTIESGRGDGSSTTVVLRSELASVRDQTGLDEQAVRQRIARLPRL